MTGTSVKPAEAGRMKKIPNLDIDEGMQPTQVLLPQKYYKKLGALALIKETSKGAIVRDALRKYFDGEDRIRETPKNVKVSNGVLRDLLGRCTTYWGNFEIEGENGFIALVKEKGIKLKDLTDAQFERVVDKLAVGYDGYADQPSVDELLGKLSELEPNEEQKDSLRKGLGGEEQSGETIEEGVEEEEEEDW